VNQQDLERAAKVLDVAARMARKSGREAIRVAKDHEYPLRSPGAARGAKGDHADPTATAIIAPEESTTWFAELERLTKAAKTTAGDLAMLLHRIVTNGEKQPRANTLTPCGNPHCDREVTQLDEDRLKDGRCPRCYKFRYRNPGIEWAPVNEPCPCQQIHSSDRPADDETAA
jgi:hypothetical protein